MAEIKGMWLQEPEPSAPDLVVEDIFECPTCGLRLTIRPSYPRNVTLRTTCPCGTDVEIVQGALIDGPGCGPVGSKAPADPHPTTGSP